MTINIREKIGRAVGQAAAEKGESIEKAIARQVKRGGVENRDIAWMREGYETARARMATA